MQKMVIVERFGILDIWGKISGIANYSSIIPLGIKWTDFWHKLGILHVLKDIAYHAWHWLIVDDFSKSGSKTPQKYKPSIKWVDESEVERCL